MPLPYAEVIGDPIAHSKSPLIHKFWLDKLGLQGDYRAVVVRPGQLESYFSSRRRDRQWRGCSVTIPHKNSSAALVDDLDAPAQSIGAVNCIAARAEKEVRLCGHNTDAEGFLDPLRPQLGLEHVARSAYVLGAGGAAAAVSWALYHEGFEVTNYARDREKARQMRLRLQIPHGEGARDLALLAAEHSRELHRPISGVFHLLVNATPSGMTGYPPLTLNLCLLPAGTLVYDLVYAPVETPLLRAAREKGMRTIDGLAMLIGQASRAFALFFGVQAPRQHDAELRELLTR